MRAAAGADGAADGDGSVGRMGASGMGRRMGMAASGGWARATRLERFGHDLGGSGAENPKWHGAFGRGAMLVGMTPFPGAPWC